ncbi:MAG: carboxypeptidase-like regulatory domain-containing protein [Kineosporiaceae bacterium]
MTAVVGSAIAVLAVIVAPPPSPAAADEAPAPSSAPSATPEPSISPTDTPTPTPTPTPSPAVSVLAQLSGRLTFADGRPARESKIELVASGREDARAWTFSDPRGSWTLETTVPAGAYQLRFLLSDGDWFWYPGTKDRDEADVLTLTGEVASALDVVWPPPARLRLTVLSPEGAPVPGICLERTRLLRCTKATGVVTLPGVDAGAVVVSGWSRSTRWFLPETTLTTQRGQTLEATLVARPTAVVRGVLLDADGTPRVGACPEAFDQADPSRARQHLRLRCADSEGRWQIGGLPEGRFLVRLTLPQAVGGGSVWWPQAAAPDGGRTVTTTAGATTDDGEVRLPDLGALAGRVVDVDGEPVEGAFVQWGPPETLSAGGPGTERSATTDRDGHFRIDGVAAWTAPILVTAPGGVYGATWSGGTSQLRDAEAITVTWGRTTRTLLTLLPAAPLTVTLTGDTVPGDGYTIEAVDERGNAVGTAARVNSDRPTGVVRGLAPGRVRLRLTHQPAGPGTGIDAPVYYPSATSASGAAALDLPQDGASVTWALP